MQVPLKHVIHDNQFWLSADRCLFWEEQKTLIVSDLHFGKTGHFRKSGIAVPQNIFKEDLQRLVAQIQFYKPSQLLVVGDMFHSSANKEMDFFLKWRSDLSQLPIHLVKGNHDILKAGWYEAAGIIVHPRQYSVEDFCFAHDVAESDCDNSASYYFTGHIHPGIILNGVGKQSLRFPCFYFTKKYAILPAFSRFTGLATVDVKRTDEVYAIVESSVIKL
ncbi:MAG: ICC-like protein phosphoesterase [Chitinophagaceae bacterium]|jgi:DNA ligase-associated metallophosphoesterase|nr:ICC-like protein phosphoesterase [Chitinophagaceae bacterium]